MTIPNIITSLRLLLVPLFGVLLWHRMYLYALLIFLVAGVSDALDGYIAKRFNLCSWLGSILDPLADKALIITSVILIAKLGLLPWWLTTVVIARDLLIVAGALTYIITTGELEMTPSVISKINTFVQLLLIFCTLSQAARLIPDITWYPFLYGVTTLFALASGGHYVLVWSAKIRQSKIK